MNGATVDVRVQEIVLEEEGGLQAHRDKTSVELSSFGDRPAGFHCIEEFLGECHVGLLQGSNGVGRGHGSCSRQGFDLGREGEGEELGKRAGLRAARP